MEFPSPAPSGYSLPPWVSPSDGLVCVVLDVSSLQEPTTVEPSPSLEQDALLSELQEFRTLYLSSVGLLIFLTAAVWMRSRTAR